MQHATRAKATELQSLTNRRHGCFQEILSHKELYLLSLPGIIFLILFKYWPMYGIVVSFKDYSVFAGFWESEWVGLANFRRLFLYSSFPEVFRNTLVIALQKLFFFFPFPIILALALNECESNSFKKSVQTITYIPHFISWVVIGGLFREILSTQGGVVNEFLRAIGREPVMFLASPAHFRPILVISEIWRDAGYGAIIYLGAIATIDPQIYEAAVIDGASRLQKIRYITLPGILSTVIVLLILRVGRLLEVGHEQILMLYNPAVYEVGDVISTFIYRVGIGNFEYSLTTAAGILRSVIGLVLIIGTNSLARRFRQSSVW